MTIAAERVAATLFRAQLKAHGPLVVLVALLGLGSFGLGRASKHDAPTIPPREQRSADSLAGTLTPYTLALAATVHAETVYVAREVQAARQGAVQLASAKSLARLADSLTMQASLAHDTSTRWEAIAATWHTVADSAEAAAMDYIRAEQASDSARAEADDRARLALLRVTATSDLNTRLLADLAKADPPCRVLWLHCPSRTVALVAGALVTVGLFEAPKLGLSIKL